MIVNVLIVAIVAYLLGVVAATVWLNPPHRDSEPRPKRGGH